MCPEFERCRKCLRSLLVWASFVEVFVLEILDEDVQKCFQVSGQFCGRRGAHAVLVWWEGSGVSVGNTPVEVPVQTSLSSPLSHPPPPPPSSSPWPRFGTTWCERRLDKCPRLWAKSLAVQNVRMSAGLGKVSGSVSEREARLPVAQSGCWGVTWFVCASLWPSGRLGAKWCEQTTGTVVVVVVDQWPEMRAEGPRPSRLRGEKGHAGESGGRRPRHFLCADLSDSVFPAVSGGRKKTQAHFDDASWKERDKDVRRDLS